MKFQRDTAAFAAIQLLYWSCFGLIFPYLVVYYHSIGFTSVEIGWLTGLTPVASVVGTPLLSMFADRTGANGRFLLISLLVGIGLSLMFLLVPPNVAPVAILSFLLACSILTLAPIIDSWIMQVRHTVPRLDYGITRAMGSAGFALTVALAGRLFDIRGIRLMFPVSALTIGIAVLLVAYVAHHYHVQQRHRDHSTAKHSAGQMRRFFNLRITSLLIVSFFTFVAFRPVHVFLPQLISLAGGSNRHLGYALAVMALSEVPIMLFYSRLAKRFRDLDIMLVALALFILRILALAVAPTPQIIIAVHAIQGLSFGLYLPAMVHLMHRWAPPNMQTFAQAMANVATFGVGSVVGSAVSGYLVDWFGVVAMYAVMAGLMAVVFVAFVLLFYYPGWIKRPATAEST